MIEVGILSDLVPGAWMMTRRSRTRGNAVGALGVRAPPAVPRECGVEGAQRLHGSESLRPSRATTLSGQQPRR
jgi:hypothetical protein